MPQHFPEPIQTIHDYVQYFGLVSLNFVYLESRLRWCLRTMAQVRSKWPITDKRWKGTQAMHGETTLGGLISEFEKLTGDKTIQLVANLRKVADERNSMLHNVILLTDVRSRRIPLDHVQERTRDLRDLSERVQGRMYAIMKFHYPVFVQLDELLREHRRGNLTDLLAEYSEMVRNYPDA